MAAIPPSRTTAPNPIMAMPMIPRTLLVPLRSTVAMRRASSGLVRAARKAGTVAETRVTTSPTTRTSITLVGEITRPMPPELVMFFRIGTTASSRRKSPTPTRSPMALATMPTTMASSHTAWRTCGPWAPRARSRANSRTRWATTIEKVL